MKKILFVLVGLILTLQQTWSVEPHAADVSAKLSPELLELLRAEMREISVGVQGIAPAVATADWLSIQSTSEKIRASYILKQKLTPAQAAALGQALPSQFKQLDVDFHRRAGLVAAAAAAHNAELVIFHYSRMLENCTACHSAFAKSRFPQFSPSSENAHHH